VDAYDDSQAAGDAMIIQWVTDPAKRVTMRFQIIDGSHRWCVMLLFRKQVCCIVIILQPAWQGGDGSG
jgi:hypothetical protein